VISLTPVRKGEAELLIVCTLNDEEKTVGVGELSVRLPSIGNLPEFRARVVTDGLNVWVLLPSGEYRRVPEHSALVSFVYRLAPLLDRGRTGMLYSDDELVHRACLIWLGKRDRNRAFLRRVADLLLAGRRGEARGLLVAREL